jgi:hypothetical protein
MKDKEETPEQKLEKGLSALQEMMTKALDWYHWTIREEIQVHPHNDYVAREYKEKIEQWMYPYINRLHATDHVTLEQMHYFSEYINGLIFKLRVKAEEATWTYHWNEMSFIDRLKWRWKHKRIKKYGLRDFERLCRETWFVPVL